MAWSGAAAAHCARRGRSPRHVEMVTVLVFALVGVQAVLHHDGHRRLAVDARERGLGAGPPAGGGRARVERLGRRAAAGCSGCSGSRGSSCSSPRTAGSGPSGSAEEFVTSLVTWNASAPMATTPISKHSSARIRTAPRSSGGVPSRRAAWRVERLPPCALGGATGYVTLNAVLVAPVSPALLAVSV